jgi:hypothetical protein
MGAFVAEPRGRTVEGHFGVLRRGEGYAWGYSGRAERMLARRCRLLDGAVNLDR